MTDFALLWKIKHAQAKFQPDGRVQMDFMQVDVVAWGFSELLINVII